MKDLIKKLIFLISLGALYLIAREAVILYNASTQIHPYLGYAVIATVLLVLGYFVVAPLYRIFATPASIRHVEDEHKIEAEKQRRLHNLRKGGVFRDLDLIQTEDESDIEFFDRAYESLDARADQIINKYARNVFKATAVSQNGFIDAVVMLSSSINLIKEIFTTYAGRIETKSVLEVLKQAYYAIAISGSEAVEQTADEVFSKIFNNVSNNIPFADAVIGSVADGYTNSILCVRLGLITKNYCSSLKTHQISGYKPGREAFNRTNGILKDMSKSGSNSIMELLKHKSKFSWGSSD